MIFGNPSVLLIATQYLCNGCHLCHGPCHVPAPLLSYGTAQNPHTSPLIYQVAPFCPACHFGILVFPDLLLKDGAIYLSLDNIPLLTTLFIAPIVSGQSPWELLPPAVVRSIISCRNGYKITPKGYEDAMTPS